MTRLPNNTAAHQGLSAQPESETADGRRRSPIQHAKATVGSVVARKLLQQAPSLAQDAPPYGNLDSHLVSENLRFAQQTSICRHSSKRKAGHSGEFPRRAETDQGFCQPRGRLAAAVAFLVSSYRSLLHKTCRRSPPPGLNRLKRTRHVDADNASGAPHPWRRCDRLARCAGRLP